MEISMRRMRLSNVDFPAASCDLSIDRSIDRYIACSNETVVEISLTGFLTSYLHLNRQTEHYLCNAIVRRRVVTFSWQPFGRVIPFRSSTSAFISPIFCLSTYSIDTICSSLFGDRLSSQAMVVL